MGNLTENGTYFIEVICKSYTCELGGYFNSFIIGDVMDTIDLSKNVYFKDKEINFYDSYYYYGTIDYKVSNLNENKYVYFVMETYLSNEYIPYYPDEPPSFDPSFDPLYNHNLTIFEVINIHNSDETKKNVKIYEFKKGNEYIIRIHSLISYRGYYDSPRSYYNKRYFFFQISEKNFKKINGDETSISSEGPMICLINPNNLKKIVMISSAIEKSYSSLLVAKSQEAIDYNLESLYQISKLEFDSEFILQIPKEDPDTTVVIIAPSDYDSKVKVYLANELEEECKGSFKIPANTAKIIYCDNDEKKLVYLNDIITFTSNEKKMHITFSEETEGTDYIIQNTIGLPIFVEKSDKEQTITLTEYYPKFAYYGAENPYLFNTLYNYVENLIEDDINLKNYMKLTQMNLRINSNYLPWNEFYNLFFNKLNMKDKVNIYIKQIYGGSDIYECDADDYDERNLTFLTTPISNVKCKNKKSLFNRLFSLDGTKILSGYLSSDSYFDIYAEINHEPENQVINISPIMKDSLGWTNTAKYLRKDIEYTLNFHSDHIIKLEPGFEAEITITNGQITSIINPKNPTFEISGKGFTIKSNNDAMVYFIGRFSAREMAQIEIDIERSRGKIVKISNIDTEIYLDIGFEGYYPSTFISELLRKDSNTYYIYNLYDKLKGKLVDKEKVFIYYYPGKDNYMSVEYIENNLDNKNTNDFNIFLIPANNEINSIPIKNLYEDSIFKADFHFCKNDAIVQVTNFNFYDDRLILTKENYSFFNKLGLYRGDTIIHFLTDKPVVFTYSLYDLTDEDFFEKNDTYWEERQEFILLKIEDVAFKKGNDKTLEIKFRRNYKKSSTRYIILIAQKNVQNTLGNFANPCYVVDLLNQRPSDLVVDTIYDVGENELIYAEVDISKIKNSDDKYIINIISQELRFNKKIKFYDPIEFSSSGIIPYDDSTDSEKTDGGNTDSDSTKNDEKSGDDESSGSSSSLALAITLPIIGILVIAVVILIIMRRKSGSSSDNIEKLTYN